MPYKDPETRKAYRAKYVRTPEYRAKNRERDAKRRKDPEKIAKKRAQNAEWQRNRPFHTRASHLRHAGCKTATHTQLSESWTGFCHACAKPIYIGRIASADHCTKRLVFRGWLCSYCNQSLGVFRDCSEALRLVAKAEYWTQGSVPYLLLAEYLERFEAKCQS